MSENVTVGLDLAKNVFQAHGADALLWKQPAQKAGTVGATRHAMR